MGLNLETFSITMCPRWDHTEEFRLVKAIIWNDGNVMDSKMAEEFVIKCSDKKGR